MAYKEFEKNTRELVRVKSSSYKGYDQIDLRIYSKSRSDDDIVPTRKGISLDPSLVPDLIDSLIWAVGQPPSNDDDDPERPVGSKNKKQLANDISKILVEHGTPLHWDSIATMSIDKVVTSSDTGKPLEKWDIRYLLISSPDLFEHRGAGVFAPAN